MKQFEIGRSASKNLLRDRLYRYFALSSIVEQQTSPVFIRFCLSIYFSIISLGMLPDYVRSKFIVDNNLMIIKGLAIIAGTYLFFLMLMLLVGFYLANSQRGTPKIIGFSIYMTIAFTYIIYPLIIYGLGTVCYQLNFGIPSSFYGTSIFLIILGVVGGALVLIFYSTRTNIPSNSPLIVPFTSNQIIVFIGLMISIILSRSRNESSFSFKSTIPIVLSGTILITGFCFSSGALSFRREH